MPSTLGSPIPSGSPADEQTMKRISSRFAAGVTVVTTVSESGFHGLTVSAYLTVSWDPPLVLVSIQALNQSCDTIKASGVFAVTFLSDRQEFLSERFAGRAPLVNLRFEGVPYRVEATGAPILEDGLAWLDCRVEQVIEAGDHILFLGRVVRAGEGAPDNALVYYARRYRHVEP